MKIEKTFLPGLSVGFFGAILEEKNFVKENDRWLDFCSCAGVATAATAWQQNGHY